MRAAVLESHRLSKKLHRRLRRLRRLRLRLRRQRRRRCAMIFSHDARCRRRHCSVSFCFVLFCFVLFCFVLFFSVLFFFCFEFTFFKLTFKKYYYLFFWSTVPLYNVLDEGMNSLFIHTGIGGILWGAVVSAARVRI